MVNLGRVFASFTQNILFWRKMKWSWGHTDTKKRNKQKTPKISFLVYKYFQSSRQNKSKFKNKYVCLLALYERAKSRNDWCFRLRLYETFCVRRSNSERDLTLLRRSIHASFRVCSCVYVNFSFMKRQQKLILFFKEWQRKVNIKVNWRRQMNSFRKDLKQYLINLYKT